MKAFSILRIPAFHVSYPQVKSTYNPLCSRQIHPMQAQAGAYSHTPLSTQCIHTHTHNMHTQHTTHTIPLCSVIATRTSALSALDVCIHKLRNLHIVCHPHANQASLGLHLLANIIPSDFPWVSWACLVPPSRQKTQHTPVTLYVGSVQECRDFAFICPYNQGTT